MRLIPPSLTVLPNGVNEQSSGNVSYDNEYFYVKYKGWKRFPLSKTDIYFGFPSPLNDGDIYTDNEYFYITLNKRWLKSPNFVIKTKRPIGDAVPVINIENTKLTTFPRTPDNYGIWGLMSFNAEYFCIWGQKKWHKIPISPMPAIL